MTRVGSQREMVCSKVRWQRFLIRLAHTPRKNVNYLYWVLEKLKWISISLSHFYGDGDCLFFCSNDCLLLKSTFLKYWRWVWANLIRQKCQKTLVCKLILFFLEKTRCDISTNCAYFNHFKEKITSRSLDSQILLIKAVSANLTLYVG